jgi:transaldolase
MNENPLPKVHTFGQSIWLDLLQRGMVASGELERMIDDDGLRGMTSNPTIFDKAIGGSQDYDEAIRSLTLAGKNVAQIYQTLTLEDVQRAADVFRPLYEQSQGGDGFVSLEVSPRLAHDSRCTILEARSLWQALERPNVMIKVPGTLEGLPAIRQLTGEGINVNVTLLFGLPRYRQVADAYIAGLEARVEQGQPVQNLASVASFFLSRIDVLVDPWLEQMMAAGGAKAQVAQKVHGQLAIASAKVAYQIYGEIFDSERFRRLIAHGARPQRLLWASTSTKNPAYNDVKYVEPLIGPETVNTVPLETFNAYRDHGNPAFRLQEGLEEAHNVLRDLPELGIDLDQVTQQLEDEGVEKFNRSLDELMETLRKKHAAILAGQSTPVV